VGTLHVYVDDEQCFGYQRCVQVAPKTFSLNETGNSVAGIQDAHIGRLGGTGQDPEALVQVDLVQHGGPSRDRVWRVPGPAPGMIRSRSTPS
jgi:ferredoxin